MKTSFEITTDQQDLIASTCEMFNVSPERFIHDAIERHIEMVVREGRKATGDVDWDKGMAAIERVLTVKGYDILENGFEGFDIVATDPDGAVVFAKVEMVQGDMVTEDLYGIRDMFEHAALHYYGENEMPDATPCRCDYITLAATNSGRAMVRHHVDCLAGTEDRKAA